MRSRFSLLLFAVLPSCAASPAAPALSSASASAPSVPPPSAACREPERRALDFWIGDWDVLVRSRPKPDSDAWQEARGTNTVRSVLGGCAVEESFHAEGPGAPWAGRSFSVFVPQAKAWRQTWVDDSGGYLAFKGGLEGDAFVLYGEPRESGGNTVRMRMAFREITAESFVWSWERGTEPATTWSPVMVIRYTRRHATP
jgi:hypothetical protein